MLTPAENELITRVGKGTPMGELMRRFWFPVCKSEQLEAGARPQRVRFLGENFVLFRVPDGRVAMFAEACPHRGASLLLGRLEDCAIRCIFHGWKIDVDGKVVDAPSEPTRRETFGAKVRVRHYPTREAGTLIWAFIGEGEPTQFPDFPFTHVPPNHVTVLQVPTVCNWLQALEGQLDSSHVGHLHKSTILELNGPTAINAATNQYFLIDSSPKFETATTPYGLRAAAIRRGEAGRLFARVTEFCLPGWTSIAGPEDEDHTIIGQVPVDDTHVTQFFIMFNYKRPIEKGGGGDLLQLQLDYDGASFGRACNPENLWGQDPTRLDNHWSGMRNVLYEDFAIAESMGPITDRSYEHLGESDRAIAAARRLLIQAARDNLAGALTCGLGGDIDYAGMVGRQAEYEEGGTWADAVANIRPHENARR